MHGHWDLNHSSGETLLSLRIWLRLFAKRHPVVLGMLEWSFGAGVALFLTIASGCKSHLPERRRALTFL